MVLINNKLKRKKKMDKISSNEREEVIDVLFLVLMVYLGISLIYQISLLQSADANLRELGRLSLGLGFVSVLGMCLTMLSTSAGLMKIKNLKKDDFRNSMKDVLVRDEDFSRDFGLTFLVALVIQLGSVFSTGALRDFN